MKALLIGNGFTLNLIPNYKNDYMMEEIERINPNMINSLNKSFEQFRNLHISNEELVNISVAVYPNDNLYPREDLIPNEDNIRPVEYVKDEIISKLKKLNFNNPEYVFYEYFMKYGLIYSINSSKLNGLETYLKVLHLFMNIDKYTKSEYDELKNIANQIYYNGGKHGLADICNNKIDIVKLCDLILGFDDIYTTNYDTILDDILDIESNFPFHLHGGFSICHKNRNPSGRFNPSNAILIWGESAESKFEELNTSLDYSCIDYGAFRYGGNSQLGDYFEMLMTREYEEMHILGYSGENDAHINNRIKENPNIQSIIIYTDPSRLSTQETIVRNRLLFKGENQNIILKPWSEFWDNCTV